MPLRQASRRSAVWPSLFGVVVVGSVLGANLWSMWHADPEPATMLPLERLGALKAGGGHELPASAVADLGSKARSDASAGAAAGPIAPAVAARSADGAEFTRSAIVQPGETLGAALARVFVQGAVQRDVIAAYARLRKPERLQAGWRLWARFAADPAAGGDDLTSVVVAPGHGEGVTVERAAQGFGAREGGLPGVIARQPLRCVLTGPLDLSLRRCGADEALAAQIGALAHDRIRPALDLRAGDDLRLLVDKLMDGDQLVRHLGIAAISVRRPSGQTTAVVHFDDGHGVEGYYTPAGDSAEAMFLRQPLRSGHTTSGFGMRLHPILHRMKAHYGVDFAAPTGTPIYAAADGTLVSAHRAGPAGNLVRVRHGEGYVTEYMHLHRFAAGIDPGDRVAKGQVIGYVGTTGRSTGPHLHFGVRKNGRYLDPTSTFDVPQAGITARARKAFDAHAAELIRILDGLDRGARPGS